MPHISPHISTVYRMNGMLSLPTGRTVIGSWFMCWLLFRRFLQMIKITKMIEKNALRRWLCMNRIFNLPVNAVDHLPTEETFSDRDNKNNSQVFVLPMIWIVLFNYSQDSVFDARELQSQTQSFVRLATEYRKVRCEIWFIRYYTKMLVARKSYFPWIGCTRSCAMCMPR